MQIIKQIRALKFEGGSERGATTKVYSVADQINDLLKENAGTRLENVLPIPLSKIGGIDYEYLVVLQQEPMPITSRRVDFQTNEQPERG